MNFPRYFAKCGVCDWTDGGDPLYDYQLVDCPSCGSSTMTRWEAKDNLSREWSYCVAFGHDWKPSLFNSMVEHCTCCHDTRDFTKKTPA